jgi:hypothetical protein
MNARNLVFAMAAAALVGVAPAGAQQTLALAAADDSTPAPEADSSTAAATAADFTRTTTFEVPKDVADFGGIHLEWHAAFSQGFQALKHSSDAAPSAGPLQALRPGFNLAEANLGLGTRLAKGIRVDLEGYMSSRHHEEFWVKGGYATIDASPIDLPLLNRIMAHTTIRAGHYEVNYGDAHYRRSDGGFTTRNPFIENYILDAFTTEIGADATVRFGSAFAVAGVTTGENKGNVKDATVSGGPKARPAYLGKIGFDRQLSPTTRVRLSGSTYQASSTPAGTLYAGDRTGSHYFGVMEKDGFVETDQFTSGRVNPGFKNEISAYQLNPFVKVGGLELFGVIETASGKAATEAARRTVRQYAGDAVYRFLGDRLYVGGRYDVVKGDLSDALRDVEVNRAALSAGWFLTPSMLTKIEYVTQEYDGFPTTDLRSGGRFHGLAAEGAISF